MGLVPLRKRRLLGHEITSWTGGDDQHQQRTSTVENQQHNGTRTASTIQNRHNLIRTAQIRACVLRWYKFMGKGKTLLKTQKIGIKQETTTRTQHDTIRTGLFRSVSDGSGPSSRAGMVRPGRKNRP